MEDKDTSGSSTEEAKKIMDDFITNKFLKPLQKTLKHEFESKKNDLEDKFEQEKGDLLGNLKESLLGSPDDGSNEIQTITELFKELREDILKQSNEIKSEIETTKSSLEITKANLKKLYYFNIGLLCTQIVIIILITIFFINLK